MEYSEKLWESSSLSGDVVKPLERRLGFGRPYWTRSLLFSLVCCENPVDQFHPRLQFLSCRLTS